MRFFAINQLILILSLPLLSSAISDLSEAGVDCEGYGKCRSGDRDCCLMNRMTSITAGNVRIAAKRRDFIKGMNLFRNQRIQFLPVHINLKFPKIIRFEATGCSIKKISKDNFQGLFQLYELNLDENFIEEIRSDTFEDLKSLKYIHLEKNRIKSMNGRLFDNLVALHEVCLKSNECININFDKTIHLEFLGKSFRRFVTFESMCRKDISSIRSEVDAKCGYEETDSKVFCKETCGAVSYTSGVVVNGNKTVRGQWPFLVAMVLASDRKFFCGANLITAKHVLTAAHCIHEKNFEKKLEPEDIILLIGRYNIKQEVEAGSETRLVDQIIIHPDWSNYSLKYEADVAVLVMDQPVAFSAFIKPVCLTPHSTIQALADGIVTGWGKTGRSRNYEDIPQQAQMNAVAAKVCLENGHQLGQIYSQRQFCASGDNAGPCSGDSGGGYFILHEGFWFMKGIVSAAAFKANGVCDVDTYSLYTNVGDFLEWIKATVYATV